MISRRSVAAVAALTLTTVGTLSGAAAAPATNLLSSYAPAGIRPIPAAAENAALVDGTTTVRKAKTVVTLPRTLLRVYANKTSVDRKNILYSQSPTWAVSHRGKHPRFGIFPVAHSAVLGFGALPITADLHLSQLVRHGQIVPIIVHSRAGLHFPFRQFPTNVTGSVSVRVSNVRVDQVPLQVGPNCHTVVPMRLRLTGNTPAYNLFTGGPLRGKATIPPFTGCGTGGDDLDPLLTGTISGPGNTINQQQGQLAVWTTKNPSDCSGCRPPTP
ncbi:MAG TPA: hypothetical protein VGH43_10060 [Jatrophihabitans sp.]|jgi:hypothetical protein